MKTKIALLLLTVSINGFAIDSNSNAVLNTSNDSVSNANSAIGTGSAIGNNTFNSVSIQPKQTPTAVAPNLTTSNDTCMGSSSAGVGVPGISLSMGSTWTDKNCVMLKNSRELWNIGQHLAGFAILCSNPDILVAIELANEVDSTAPHCPQTTVALKKVAAELAKQTNANVYPKFDIAPASLNKQEVEPLAVTSPIVSTTTIDTTLSNGLPIPTVNPTGENVSKAIENTNNVSKQQQIQLLK